MARLRAELFQGRSDLWAHFSEHGVTARRTFGFGARLTTVSTCTFLTTCKPDELTSRVEPCAHRAKATVDRRLCRSCQDVLDIKYLKVG